MLRTSQRVANRELLVSPPTSLGARDVPRVSPGLIAADFPTGSSEIRKGRVIELVSPREAKLGNPVQNDPMNVSPICNIHPSEGAAAF